MRSLSVWICALACAFVVGAAGLAGAEEPSVSDHSARDHVFVTILALKVKPDVQHIKAGDAVGWLNYTNRIARVYFDKDVAKKMTCTSKGTFRLNGDWLESTDIQAQQFASLCSLAAGEYPYRVELRSGVGTGAGGVSATIQGKIVAE